MYRRPGHRITLPPYDYSSRVLGHITFRPLAGFDLADEGAELESLVDIEVNS
jgi:hypothetical protein